MAATRTISNNGLLSSWSSRHSPWSHATLRLNVTVQTKNHEEEAT